MHCFLSPFTVPISLSNKSQAMWSRYSVIIGNFIQASKVQKKSYGRNAKGKAHRDPSDPLVCCIKFLGVSWICLRGACRRNPQEQESLSVLSQSRVVEEWVILQIKRSGNGSCLQEMWIQDLSWKHTDYTGDQSKNIKYIWPRCNMDTRAFMVLSCYAKPYFHLKTNSTLSE